jgi:integrase
LAGYVKKVSKNCFDIFVEAGKNPGTGKRKRICRRFHGNQTVAKKELARLETEIALGIFLEPTGQTVAGYLRWWLPIHSKARNLAPITAESYRDIIEDYIIPGAGAISLEQLDTLQVQNWINKLSQNKSGRTSAYALSILRMALKHAVIKWKLIRDNPAAAVEKPESQPADKRAEEKALTPEQMQCFLDTAEGTRDYPLILTAMYTGMRREELLGLHWSEVDLQAGKLEVAITMERIRHQGLVFRDKTKTPASRRIVALPDTVVEELRKVKAKQEEGKAFYKRSYYDNNLVFCLDDGRPLDPRCLHTRFKKIAAKAGVPSFSFHGQRHTYATLLLANGVDVSVVQSQLGHARSSTTLDMYRRVLPNEKRKAANLLDEKFGRGQNAKNRADNGQIE